VLALLGTLWAVLEIHLGKTLHILHIPFTGIILTFWGMIILLVGRAYIPKRGTSLFLGFCTGIITFLMNGIIAVFAAMAILIESLVTEFVFTLPLSNSFRCAIAGTSGMLWCLVHPFITQGIIIGHGLFTVYAKIINSGAQLLGLSPNYALFILLVLVVGHAGIGLLAGFCSRQVSRRLQSMTSFVAIPSKNL